MTKDGRVDSYGIHDSGLPMKKENSNVSSNVSSKGAVFTPKEDLEVKIREEKRPEEQGQVAKSGREHSLRVTKAFIDDEGKGLARIALICANRRGSCLYFVW